MTERPFYVFGTFHLDATGRLLLRDNEPVPLPPKAVDILLVLVEHAGTVVSKDDLLRQVWQDAFVEEGSLTRAISVLRKALGDGEDGQKFIDTISRRGYRFTAPVKVVANGTDEAPIRVSRRRLLRWMLAGLAIFVIVAVLAVLNISNLRATFRGNASPQAIRSLAVLPLENLSGDPNQEYFVDGMTDALITDLAKMREVKVISRTSAMQYKGTHRPLPEIARALYVDAVVEGSVVRSGDRVRITAQLIHAPSDRHLWADSFEGPATDILSIQDEVARAVTDQIQGQLGVHSQRPLRSAKSIDPGAYEAYLRGIYFFDKRTAEASSKSVDYFRKAIVAAPEFAPAYAGLAEALPAMCWFNGKPPVDAMAEAKAAAKHAIELDDGLAEAHTALGALLSLYDWNWHEAEKEFKRALDLNPNSSLAHERYMMWLLSVGRVPESVIEAKRAQQLDPLSFFMNRELAHSLYVAGRYDEALEQLRRSEELEPQSKGVVRNWIAWIYELQGKQKEAVDLYLLQMADEGIPQAQIDALRGAYTKDGWKGYWTKWLHFGGSGHRALYDTALAEARLGHSDKVWEWMGKSADEREVWVTWIRVDPLLESSRSHPAYKQLLQRINLPD